MSAQVLLEESAQARKTGRLDAQANVAAQAKALDLPWAGEAVAEVQQTLQERRRRSPALLKLHMTIRRPRHFRTEWYIFAAKTFAKCSLHILACLDKCCPPAFFM